MLSSNVLYKFHTNSSDSLKLLVSSDGLKLPVVCTCSQWPAICCKVTEIGPVTLVRERRFASSHVGSPVLELSACVPQYYLLYTSYTVCLKELCSGVFWFLNWGVGGCFLLFK